MKYKGTLIVVKDCNRALKFYSDMFGFQLLQDNDVNIGRLREKLGQIGASDFIRTVRGVGYRL